MGTSAVVYCGDKTFCTYYDGYVSGLGHALSCACEEANQSNLSLTDFAEYLKKDFSEEHRFNLEEGTGAGGFYEYTIHDTGGLWVSVYDGYNKTEYSDADDAFWEAE